MFFPQSREPRPEFLSLYLRRYTSGQAIAGPPALRAGARQGHVPEVHNNPALTLRQSSACGCAGVGSDGGGPGPGAAAAAGLNEQSAARSNNPFAGSGQESFGGLPRFQVQSNGGARGGERHVTVPEGEWRDIINREQPAAKNDMLSTCKDVANSISNESRTWNNIALVRKGKFIHCKLLE